MVIRRLKRHNCITEKFTLFPSGQSACVNNPCKNNATCQSGFTDKGYHCLCTAGFKGLTCDEGEMFSYYLSYLVLYYLYVYVHGQKCQEYPLFPLNASSSAFQIQMNVLSVHIFMRYLYIFRLLLIFKWETRISSNFIPQQDVNNFLRLTFGIPFQISMNVLLEITTVVPMPCAATPRDRTIAHA